MLLGYNTNGFAHHRLEDAISILAEMGYQSIAITLDVHSLNPFSADLTREIRDIRSLLDQYNLRSVIETGARFLLDSRKKHQPTLVSPSKKERYERLAFLCSAVSIAEELGSDAVSFWSGTPVDDADYSTLLSRLVNGCKLLCDFAYGKKIRLAFEPEPGMLIDRMDRFAEFQERVDHPSLGLTIDIGHLHCLGEVPISDYLQQWQQMLWNVHIEDMRRGVHDHLMFGEGEIDFVPVMGTLREIGYEGGMHVELSRHSHNAVETARKALEYLGDRI